MGGALKKATANCWIKLVASGGVVRVGVLIETCAVADLQLDAVEAGVARHESLRGIVEADQCRDVEEGVADELGAVGILDLDALEAPADDGVVLESVVYGPSRVDDGGKVGAEIREGVVPDHGRRGGWEKKVFP